MNALSGQNYRQILQEELAGRCQKNPKYSLRAFAKDLLISPQRLSHVLNGNYGLSGPAAVKIAKRIGLSHAEAEVFCALVESEHARGRVRRDIARQKVNELRKEYTPLSVDTFKIMADWYHFAILELTLVDDFDADPSWIAKTLGISIYEANSAIQRLKKLEFLEEKRDGSLKLGAQFDVNPAGIPSDAVKKFHKQLLEKAMLAIDLQSLDDRDFSSVILAMDSADIPLAKKKIRKFQDEFDAEFSKAAKKSSVYCLGVQLFRLRK
ncbi:MAG: TIGR02147 family protein [Bdellovibrionota bacterium]